MEFEPQSFTWQEVFGPTEVEGIYLQDFTPADPITFFVGPNGSGKSRTAQAYEVRYGTDARRLSTDRLTGLMNFANYGFASLPQGASRGIPVGGQEEAQLRQLAAQGGVINDAFYILRENPDIYLRVNAVVSRIFHRDMRLSESAGYIEPRMLFRQRASYSLLNDEGHGLRELIALLAFTYFAEPPLLIVDEPELHLHPSMARFWIDELRQELSAAGRRAIVVTHEPALIQPKTFDDLHSILVFREGEPPIPLGSAADPSHYAVIEGSLGTYPDIVSSLVFSPRPVLVEGLHDRAGLEVASRRLFDRGAASQTDFVPCQGSSGVAAWFEIARKAGIDAVAVADLDAVFDVSFQRAMDRNPDVTALYAETCLATPPTTREVLRDLYRAMNAAQVPRDPKARALWLADLASSDGGLFHRKAALLDAWSRAGVWLHPQGTLEAVLNLTQKASVEVAREAARTAGGIDDVAQFSRFRVDTSRTLEDALLQEVRRIVHEVQRELARTPELQVTAPLGTTSDFDRRLVDITPAGPGRHKVTVKSPRQFAGCWVEFLVNTSTTDVQLNSPTE